MKRKWRITADDGEHTVEYRQSLLGFVKIKIDENEFNLGFVSAFKRRTEPFRVGSSPCMLTIKFGGDVEITSNECSVEKL